MKKLWNKFLEMDTIKLYLLAMAFQLVWNISIIIPLTICGAEYSQNVASFSDLSCSFISGVALLPLVVFLEEILFRWLPMLFFFAVLGIFVKICKIDDEKRSNIEKYGLIPIVIISSIVFGLVHGTVFNILLQGVGGVIIYLFYLRALYRRKQAGKKTGFQTVPLLSSTLYHLLFDIPIMWIVGLIYSIVYLRKERRKRKLASEIVALMGTPA